MTQPTYTPILIEGKYELVKDAPEEKEFENDGKDFYILRYEAAFNTCERIPTLSEHHDYWESKEGVKMTEGKNFIITKAIKGNNPYPTYATPKPDDKDVWEEFKGRFESWLFENGEDTLDNLFSELKQHYSITKR